MSDIVARPAPMDVIAFCTCDRGEALACLALRVSPLTYPRVKNLISKDAQARPDSLVGYVRYQGFVHHMQRETENQNNFSNVYTLLDLDEPSAKSIRDLDTIMGESQRHSAEQHQHALVTETQKRCISIGERFHWAGVA